jgi:hypothetical protein
LDIPGQTAAEIYALAMTLFLEEISIPEGSSDALKLISSGSLPGLDKSGGMSG